MKPLFLFGFAMWSMLGAACTYRTEVVARPVPAPLTTITTRETLVAPPAVARIEVDDDDDFDYDD